MNTKIILIAMSVFFLSYCSGGSGGSGGSDDQRSNFLGTWEFVYDLNCGGSITEGISELVITEEEGSSLGMLLTFDESLELHAIAFSETGLGITAEDITDITFDGNGFIQEDGSLGLVVTSSTSYPLTYCVQNGVATPF